MVQIEKLKHSIAFWHVDWRRWTIGISWNRKMDDWKVHLPVISLVIWLKD